MGHWPPLFCGAYDSVMQGYGLIIVFTIAVCVLIMRGKSETWIYLSGRDEMVFAIERDMGPGYHTKGSRYWKLSPGGKTTAIAKFKIWFAPGFEWSCGGKVGGFLIGPGDSSGCERENWLRESMDGCDHASQAEHARKVRRLVRPLHWQRIS